MTILYLFGNILLLILWGGLIMARRKRGSELIVKAKNCLIEARWIRFSLAQKKTLWHIANGLQKAGYTRDHFEVKELLMPEKTKVLDIDTGEIYESETSKCATFRVSASKIKLDSQTLNFALKKLQETRLEYHDGKKIHSVSAIPKANWADDEADVFEITIYAEMLVFLLELQTRYTEMNLHKIMSLQSKHSLRLYEKLSQIKNQNFAMFKLQSLKEINEFFDTKYKKISDVNKYILTTVKKELDEKSDITFEYAPIYEPKQFQRFDDITIKKGRRAFVGYIFYVIMNRPQRTLF